MTKTLHGSENTGTGISYYKAKETYTIHLCYFNSKCEINMKRFSLNSINFFRVINVMVYVKPGEYMRMIFFSASDTGILGKRK